MNRTELKQKIKENVYQNAFGEISGDNLQKVLLDMVDFSNKVNDENFEKEEIVIVNPQGYYVPSGVKINDIGSNLTAGENIKIEDDTISAIGYKYNEDKNSISIGGGEKIVTRSQYDDEGNEIIEEIEVEGKTQAVGKNSFASGFNSIAYGEGSHAEGIGTFAYGEGSHAEGSGDTKIVNFTVNKMTQEIADILINYPQFSGNLGVENTYYSTDESIMQGSGAIISYSSSGFTGLFLYNNESQSIGDYIGYPTMSNSVTYNDETMFVFQYSGSIGIDDGQHISWLTSNYTTGKYSHAEGGSTKAECDYSHAEGYGTRAVGYASHTEGDSTTASGWASHAEGIGTRADGYASHTEGSGTIAFGNCSHAEGNPGYMNTFQQQEQIYEWDEEGNEYIYYVDNYNWEEGTNIINCVNLSIYNFNIGDVLIIEKYDEYNNLIEGPINIKIVNINIDYENSQLEIDKYLYFDAQYTQLTTIKYAAIGDFSHREGVRTTASGYASHAEGSGSIGIGQSSHAEGSSTEAFGWHSHAEGSYTQSNGEASHAEGIGSKANGGSSHAEGYDTIASGQCSHSEGSGSIGIGNASHAEGIGTRAEGYASHTEGSGTIASGYASHSEGDSTTASGWASHAGGYNSQANGTKSFVHGNNCIVHTSGENAHTIGIDNYVSNSGCIALGKGLTTHRDYCTYLGQHNKQLPGDWNNVIAVVGDGTDSSNKRNIVVIQSGNEPSVYCRGAFKNDATWINDFGEYFEWIDGNPNNEDRVGYLVQLNENKIELAQSIDECVGAISATAGFIGGACSLDWHGIYLRDVFGRYITDENGNSVINPEYDETKNYIPREKRPEWDIVGLLGQVVVRQDGTLKAGKYFDCKDGIATYADSGKYKVLKVIDNDVALILIK